MKRAKNALLLGAVAILMWMPLHVTAGETILQAVPGKLEWIQLSPDKLQFIGATSKARFRPWGFNYDHDAGGRLLEDYAAAEWSKVVSDFEEMKALGANTVRIHLQVARFMRAATEPNPDALALLGRLVTLAEKTGLYLDVTGLGCYHKQDVPAWYDALDEAPRWEVQARFWQAVAKICKRSPAVFCYDLMNEPVLSTDQKNRDWTPGEFGGKHFVQRLTLDLAGRTQAQVARAWVDKLVEAIRGEDARHLITVGEIPWVMVWPNAKPLFHAPEVGAKLDFVSIHVYPETGKLDKVFAGLKSYAPVGKPIVIEETFPLKCSMADLDRFIGESRNSVDGWIGFYWGKTITEYEADKQDIHGAIIKSWLQYFVTKTPDILGR
jgi:hypothetical protein